MFKFAWIFLLLSFHQTTFGYIETVKTSGCETCKLHLTCRHLNSIIAVLEANFIAEISQLNNSIAPTSFPPFHPRQALNRRCSGVNHCSFILAEDCPGADTWGAGNLSVTYACISEDRIKTFCNSEIILPKIDDDNNNNKLQEGFIHNPGYPRFYSSEKECRWKIRAPYQQQIRITILDISVIVENADLSDQCTDHLEIKDSDQTVHSTCRQQEPPLEITSGSDTVEIILASSHSLIPLRGVLLHYTAVGCPTPPAPEDGYLVYRNETTAEYRCCVGFVFSDSGKRARFIHCLGSIWDVVLPVPNCRRKIEPLVQVSKKIKKPEMASDLLAPALLIVALFLINFIVLFYIYKIKQKHSLEDVDEELGTLPVVKKEKERTSP